MIDLHSKPQPQHLIRNCEFKFKCSKQWDELLTSSSPRAVDSPRRCNECHQIVWKADNEEQLAEHILYDRCVAITPELYDRTVVEERRNITNRATSGRLLGAYSLKD